MSRLRHVARELLADMDNSLTDLSSQLYSIKETLRDPESRSVAKEKLYGSNKDCYRRCGDY